MRLTRLPYNRSEFFSYRADHSFRPAAPILEVSSAADFVVEDLCSFDYIESAAPVTIAISAAALDVVPYRFFAHLHLCRVAYGDIELELTDRDDFLVKISAATADGTARDEAKKIIDAVGSRQLFRKDVLDAYFDLFHLRLD